MDREDGLPQAAADVVALAAAGFDQLDLLRRGRQRQKRQGDRDRCGGSHHHQNSPFSPRIGRIGKLWIFDDATEDYAVLGREPNTLEVRS